MAENPYNAQEVRIIALNAALKLNEARKSHSLSSDDIVDVAKTFEAYIREGK